MVVAISPPTIIALGRGLVPSSSLPPMHIESVARKRRVSIQSIIIIIKRFYATKPASCVLRGSLVLLRAFGGLYRR
jgi:hypothetical protein